MLQVQNYQVEGLCQGYNSFMYDINYDIKIIIMRQARSQGGFGGFDRTTLFSANRIKTYGTFIRAPPTLISRERGQDGKQTEVRDLYIMTLNQKKVPFQ